MKYQDIYAETINKLKNNQRPLVKLTPDLIEELKDIWQAALLSESIDEASLKKILCILDNSQNMTSSFNELFFSSLDKVNNFEIIIYLLSASQKHVVGEALKSGQMIPIIYFEQLKKLLKSKNPEVLEWTLRTIEVLGPLSLRLKNEVRQVKPGFFSRINQHQKASYQIIELLEKQWERMLL